MKLKENLTFLKKLGLKSKNYTVLFFLKNNLNDYLLKCLSAFST